MTKNAFSNACLFNFCQVDYLPLHVTHKLASTVWKACKYGVFSGPYFPTFGLNTERYENWQNTESFPRRFVGVFRLNVDIHEKCPNAEKYRPEQTPYLDTWYLDTFHTVIKSQSLNEMPMTGRLIILWAFSGIAKVFYIGEFNRDDIGAI